MLGKGLLKTTALLLLFAVLGLVLPLHDILHEHKDQITYAAKGESTLSNFEKPCCKVSNFYHHAHAVLKTQDFTFYNVSYQEQEILYVDAITLKSFSTSNKAPPTV